MEKEITKGRMIIDCAQCSHQGNGCPGHPITKEEFESSNKKQVR